MIRIGSPFSTASRRCATGWRLRPDVAIVIYNDHGLNFFLDKMPTFAVGAAPEYRNADEGWGIPMLPPFQGDPALSWHLIESLVAEDFDLTTCQEMLVDHAFTLPLALLWPDRNGRCAPSGVREHGAGAAALGGALLPARPGHRAGGRVLVRRRTGRGVRHRRPVASARRRARRLHQQGLRSEVHRQPDHDPAGRRNIRPSNWWKWPAPRVSNC